MVNTHNHGPVNYNGAFAVGVVLNFGFVIAEVIFGFTADSLALLADAGHNLSDVAGLLLAWGASVLSRLQPTAKRTYGYRSTTIIAALVNAVILLIAVGGIALESVQRFKSPAPAAGETIIIVAAIGVVINTATALLFFAGRKKDLNIRGAYLHMASDAGVSVGVVLAGIGIMTTGWLWIDPLVSLVIVAIILVSTWGLLKESMNLALQAVPAGIDTQMVSDYLCRLPGVTAVHDLHIWAISTTETALTAHLVKPDPIDDDALITQARRDLFENFGIDHMTLQWERNDSFVQCGAACETKKKINGG
ncbi:MAG: cation diffusion facilitator family transporter [Desulfobacterales bacterium]|jgi:cobalt-zinc-cadmium efflux system protein